ncbi:MAG: DMT family transporter [Gemmatimonadetes bacterium]|nr:DMT family transporter [Gemmatimonadota bacterium]
MTPRSRARLEILCVAFLFSTGGAAIKAVTFSSWQVASLRSGVAALAVWLFLPAARRLRRGQLAGTLLVAVAYAATLVLFVLANRLTTAANTIFLQSTAPLYILLLGPWLLKEPLHRRDLGFMAAVAVGMAFFFLGRQTTFATAPDPVKGNVLALASGVTYAAMLIGLRWMGTRGGSPASAVVLGNLIAFAVALPAALPLGGAAPRDWAIILYLGIFQIGLAYALLTRAIPHVPALETSLLLFLEPALNPLLAWAVHGEYPGPWALVGGVLIMAATGVKSWADARRDAVVPAAPPRAAAEPT